MYMCIMFVQLEQWSDTSQTNKMKRWRKNIPEQTALTTRTHTCTYKLASMTELNKLWFERVQAIGNEKWRQVFVSIPLKLFAVFIFCAQAPTKQKRANLTIVFFFIRDEWDIGNGLSTNFERKIPVSVQVINLNIFFSSLGGGGCLETS